MINMRNASFKEVLQVIENQTGYHFLYDSEEIGAIGLISVSVTGVSLEVALDACFKNQPVAYRIFKNTIVLKRDDRMKAYPHTVMQSVIRGRVTDKEGE